MATTSESAKAAIERLFLDWKAGGPRGRKGTARHKRTITELAVSVGVERATLYVWRRQGYVPEEWVPKLSEVTGWHPGQIRPDLANYYYDRYEQYFHDDSDPPPA
jgi:hypothetical protein